MGGISILILGATGYIGRHVATAALAQGHPTFLLVRESTASNPDKAQLLESFTSKGATLLYGSIDDYASLVEAVKKVDVVICTVGAPQVADQFTLIKAIKDVGTIKRFFPSEFGIDVDRHHAEEPLKSMFDLKAKVRRAIEVEGIPYTYVVSNSFAGYFLANFAQLGLTAPPRDKIVIYGDGTTKAVYCKEEDVGTFTIKAVDDPRTLNKILYMRPPANTISTNDLVALWEAKIGKTLEKVYLSEEQVLKLLQDPDVEIIALSPTTLMATNRFVCEVCNKGFQRQQNLQLHRRGHNLPWKLRKRTTKEIKRRVYLFPEPTCVHHDPSRALGDLTGIKKQFCRKHGEKKWKCDKCAKRYDVQLDWKAHSKTWIGVTVGLFFPGIVA